MKLEREDRIAPPAKSDNGLFLSAALALVIAAAIGLVVFPELRETARRAVFSAAALVGVKPPPDAFAAAYQRLGLAPFPASLLASTKISSSLEILTREPCDKDAIFALGEALVAEHEKRLAADAYSGFASACPNGEGDKYRAAQLLLQLGDSDKTIALANALIEHDPSVANYRYLRGKALAGAKRYAEALADYRSTIQLQKNPRDVGEWVFTEMAEIYAALGKPCEAAVTILAFVAIDPASRNTPKAHKLIAEYSARGCQQNAAPPDLKSL